MFSPAEKTVNHANLHNKQAGRATFFKKATEETFTSDVNSRSFFHPAIQSKLTVSQPDDPYEKEADAVAENVMKMPEPVAGPANEKEEEKLQRKEEDEKEDIQPNPSRKAAFFHKENIQEPGFFADAAPTYFFTPAIQRKCENCGEEDKQAQRLENEEDEENGVQRVTDNKEEEKDIQRQAEPKEEEKEKTIQKKESATNFPAVNIGNYISALSGKGSPLSAKANTFFSSRIGFDFSDVKMHTGTDAAGSAKSIYAKAYNVANHVVFNEGRYQPETDAGKKLLAHELAHVVQQNSEKTLTRKDDAETAQECTAGSVDLEALTNANYKKGKGTGVGEKTKKSSGCDLCDDDSCVSITGKLNVPYSVKTKINLPPVPSNLSPCQSERVRIAVNITLLSHEKEHVKAFKSFNGIASLPIKYHGCSSDYVAYQEDLAEQEFQRRQTNADAKSAILDPFSVPVDLCCIDKPKK